MQTTWDLSIFDTELTQTSLEKAFQELVQNYQTYVSRYTGKLQLLAASDWLTFFQEDELLTKEAYRLAQPVQLQSVLEQTNSVVTSLERFIEAQFTQLSLIILPLSQEIKELGYDTLMTLAGMEELHHYRNYFVQTAHSVQYKLSLLQEKVIVLKDQSLSSNYIQLYDQLTALKMYDWNGEQVTEGKIRALRTDTDTQVRRRAFELLASYYGDIQQQTVRGIVYYGIVSDWVNEAKLRGYTSAIAVQNISEEMGEAEVECLLDGVGKLYPLYHRFLEYKAKKLRLAQLPYSDIFAPLNGNKTVIPFAEGYQLTLETLGSLSPDLKNYIEQLFASGRVDVFPKSGKQGGAFASYNKFWGQYVKLNYTDDIDSVTTLAHELGHAYHGELSKDQPQQVFSTPLVLAETASTFFQLLVIDSLVEKKPDLAEHLVFELCEDFFATVVRQIQYVRFEQKIHQKVWDGGVFDWRDCNEIWSEEVEQMLGANVVHERRLYEANWSSIPHLFHTPFYCYAYAYGLLFALALYQNYKEQGNTETVWSILRLGGSKTPGEIREIAGIDSVKSMLELGKKQVESWIARLSN